MKRLTLTIVFLFGANLGLLHAQDWYQILRDARKAYLNKNYEESFKLYESIKDKVPKNVDISEEMGQTAYRAKQFDAAEQYFNKGTETVKNPNLKSKRFHNIGNVRMQKKDYQGAVEAYKEALRQNPTDSETRYNLSEAIRKLKKNNQPPPPPQNQPPDKKEPPKDNQQKNNNPPPKQPKNPEQPNKSSNLPDKTVDRLLDKLMKDEGRTKRKMGGNKGEKNNSVSGKDW